MITLSTELHKNPMTGSHGLITLGECVSDKSGQPVVAEQCGLGGGGAELKLIM